MEYFFFWSQCCIIYSLCETFKKNENSFLFLSRCTEELISTPKIIRFLPNVLATGDVPRMSNPMPYQEYLYLSISASLTNLNAPNEEFSNVG